MNKPVDETGLVQVGARYYDPVIARFITVDPVMDLTDPQQWNAYTYANGNPVTWADPTGKWPDWLDDAASAVGDGISSAWDATTTWVDEHQADIVAGVAGAVVGGGCLLLTAGAGSIACGALGGAAAGAASHAWRAQVQHTEEFSWGAMGREALIGGVTGGATAGIGQIPGVRQLANRATTAISNRISPYLGRPPTATLPRPSVQAPALPTALQQGANAQTGVHVYFGVRSGRPVYAGITNNIARRQEEHGARFTLQALTGGAGLTRGQARAVEQALIVRNRPNFANIRNSISPTHSYYQDAVSWGEYWLKSNGH